MVSTPTTYTGFNIATDRVNGKLVALRAVERVTQTIAAQTNFFFPLTTGATNSLMATLRDKKFRIKGLRVWGSTVASPTKLHPLISINSSTAMETCPSIIVANGEQVSIEVSDCIRCFGQSVPGVGYLVCLRTATDGVAINDIYETDIMIEVVE